MNGLGRKIAALLLVLVLVSTVLASSSVAQEPKDLGTKEARSVITVLVVDPNSNQLLDIANYILGRDNTFWEDLQQNYTNLNIVCISPTSSLSTAISTHSPKVIVLSDLNLKLWELHRNNNYATLKSFTQNGGGLVITHGTFFDLTISIEGATYSIGPNRHVGLKDDLSGVEFDSLNTLTGLGYLTLYEALKIYLAEIIGAIVSAMATPAAGAAAEALFKSIPLCVPYVPFNSSMIAQNVSDPLLSNVDIHDHTFCLDIDCPICRGAGDLSTVLNCWLCNGDGDLNGKPCLLCGGDGQVFDDCFACGGTGEFGMGIFSGMCGEGNCSVCHGDGKMACPFSQNVSCLGCGGDGNITCQICGGDGWFDIAGVGLLPCIWCGGSISDWTGGRGWYGCPLCGGFGGTPGSGGIGGWCSNGKISCLGCGGDGNVTCGLCGGEGKLTCPICNGDGISDITGLECTWCGGNLIQPGNQARGWFGCLGCGGDGVAASGRGWFGCLLCGGDGGSTKGKGWNPCLACGGSLEDPLDPWDDKPGRGWITCPFCTGVFICPFCDGTGEPISTKCYYCNATGKAPYTLVGWQLEYPELIAEKILEDFENFINSTNAMFSPATHELNHILGTSIDHNEINQKMLEASKELRKFFRKMYEARCALPNITINVPNITLAVPMPEGTKNITITEERTITITLPAEIANIICGLFKPAEIVALSSDERAAILKYEGPTHRSVYFSFKPESTSNSMNQRLMYNAINWSSVTPPPLPSIADLIVPENVKNTYEQIKGQYNNFFSYTEKLNTSGIAPGAGVSTHQINVQNVGKIVSLLTSSSGKVKLKLISPNGTVYSNTGTNVRKVEITNPEDGVWTIQAESLGNGEGVMDLYRLEMSVNTRPTASFSAYPMTVYTYENITFDASTSHDNDLNGAVTQYYFDFGDGTTSGWQTQATASHHYSDDGLYDVRVKVKDNLDAESDWSNITTITVNNRAPTADAGKDVIITEGESASFTGIGSDIDGTIVLYEWDFDGDGNYDWNSTATGSTAHLYGKAGTYQATLRVTDDDGATATSTITVEVKEKPIYQRPEFIGILVAVIAAIAVVCALLLRRRRTHT